MTVERGCGTRQQGGIYLEVPMGPHGRPVEDFLVDPPRRIDPGPLGVTPIGVRLVESSRGAPYVLDWVGKQHYPCVADFVEEARRYGVSRRIPQTADFAALLPGSRIYLMHERAIVTDRSRYWPERSRSCPHALARHDVEVPDEMCASLWWNDADATAGTSVRVRPGFSYTCKRRPLDIDRGPHSYQLGIFMALPIARIVVIRAAKGGHEVAEHAARRSSLPVVIEDE